MIAGIPVASPVAARLPRAPDIDVAIRSLFPDTQFPTV